MLIACQCGGVLELLIVSGISLASWAGTYIYNTVRLFRFKNKRSNQ